MQHLQRDFGRGSQLFDGGHPFPVPLGAVVDVSKLSVHAVVVYTSVYSCACVRACGLQEAKGCITQREGAGANERQLAILLLGAGLVVVGELGLLGHSDLCLMSLIIQRQGRVGILEVVECFVLFAVLLCNPVQELGAILLVLRVVALILLKGQVVAFLFIQRGLAAVARQILREVVAPDERDCVKHGPADHDSDSGHRVYIMFRVCVCVCVCHKAAGACVCVCVCKSNMGRLLTRSWAVSSGPRDTSSGRCCPP